MSRPAEDTRSVQPLDVSDFEAVIERFEEAWRAGTRPEIDAFLPDDLASRHKLLAELIQIDWEYRLKAGDAVSEDEYRARFPEAFEQAETLSRKLSQVARQFVQRRSGSAPAKTSASSGLQPGAVLGNYTIVEAIGQGGMGQVFKATHRTMKRTVALKVIAPKSGWTDESVERFRREVETVARLSHPNIVTAHDADDVNGVRFLVMELVNGIDLSRLVRERGPLPIEVAVNYVLQAARGLEHAHSEGIIHRDIKPGNLIVNAKGVVKVLDLGLARWQAAPAERSPDEHSLTQSGQVVGTVDYMSPEQALHTKYADERSDIYSLGCTLWFLLTGRPVYGGDSAMERLVAHREQRIPNVAVTLRANESPTPELVSGVQRPLHYSTPAAIEEDDEVVQKPLNHRGKPGGDSFNDVERLDTLFQRMIAKKPDERLQTMAEVIAALESLLPRAATSETHFAPALASNSATVMTRGTNTSGGVANPSDVAQLETAPSAISAEQATDIVSKPGTTSILKTPLLARTKLLWLSVAASLIVLAAIVIVKIKTQDGKETEIAIQVPGKVQSVTTDIRDGAAPLDVKSRPGTPDHAAERAVAEWVLSVRGVVTVRVGGQLTRVAAGEKLPMESFQIVGVELSRPRGVTREGLKCLSGLMALESLQIAEVPGLTDDWLDPLKGLPKLRELKLTAMNECRITDAVIPVLRTLPSLSLLDIFSGDLSDAGFAELATLPGLRSISFGGHGLTDAAVESFAKTEIEHIFLQSPRLTPRSVLLATRCPRLGYLAVSADLLNDESTAALRSCATLRILRITQANDDVMTRVEGLTQLEMLDLAVNLNSQEPTDAGFAKLKSLLRLRRLECSHVPISDEGLEHIAAITSLKEFRFDQSRITPAGLAKFRAARPDVEIGSDIVETDYAAERDVAEWALSVGGRVRLRVGEQLPDFNPGDELPPQPFVVERLDVRGYRKLSDDDLRRVGRLSSLRGFFLGQASEVTDAGWDALRPAVTGLREMNFVESGINPRGLALIGDMSKLKRIVAIGITDAEMKLIASLPELEVLDIGFSKVTNAGLKTLGQKPKLISLKMGETEITDDGCELLSQFPNLEDLGMYGKLGVSAHRPVAKAELVGMQHFSGERGGLRDSAFDSDAEASHNRVSIRSSYDGSADSLAGVSQAGHGIPISKADIRRCGDSRVVQHDSDPMVAVRRRAPHG